MNVIRCRLLFKRLLINLVVVLILAAAFFAIYQATSFSFKNLENLKEKTQSTEVRDISRIN